jgi:hypothetical protein
MNRFPLLVFATVFAVIGYCAPPAFMSLRKTKRRQLDNDRRSVPCGGGSKPIFRCGNEATHGLVDHLNERRRGVLHNIRSDLMKRPGIVAVTLALAMGVATASWAAGSGGAGGGAGGAGGGAAGSGTGASGTGSSGTGTGSNGMNGTGMNSDGSGTNSNGMSSTNGTGMNSNGMNSNTPGNNPGLNGNHSGPGGINTNNQ